MLRNTFLLLSLPSVLLLPGLPALADIYAYTDKNGVRHISNRPNDPRYQRVMSTPTYKRPAPAPGADTPDNTDGTDAVAGTDSEGDDGGARDEVAKTAAGAGWKILRPGGGGYGTISSAKGGQIYWGGGRGKPFAVNERNRKQLSRHIARIAAQHRLDPHLLHAVISAESAFNPRAVSHAGAMGLMQLMPATAQRFGVSNPFDPVSNIKGGARYLRWLLTHFRNNLRLALAGYNAGENAVKKYGYRIPPYKETQSYVGRVLRFYHHYRNSRS